MSTTTLPNEPTVKVRLTHGDLSAVAALAFAERLPVGSYIREKVIRPDLAEAT